MWQSLKKANEIAAERPVRDDVVERIQAIADKVAEPVEKALIENLKLAFVMYKKEHGSFNGY